MGGLKLESLELRIFRQVALEKSITKAAERMGYVQSNVTAHIHNLEAELGTALFIRNNKGVNLTDDGEQLLVYADQILTLLDTAKNRVRRDESFIRIGATATIAVHRLPVWLSAYQHTCSGVRFSVSTNLQPELIRAVADGNLDCAFVYTEYSHPKLESAFVFREKLAVIAPKDLKSEEITHRPIVISSAPGCPLQSLLENWISKRVSQKPGIIQFDTVESIIKAVSLGIGISLLPISVLTDSDTKNFQILQADDIDEVSIQLLISKNSENPYLTQFVDTVKTGFFN